MSVLGRIFLIGASLIVAVIVLLVALAASGNVGAVFYLFHGAFYVGHLMLALCLLLVVLGMAFAKHGRNRKRRGEDQSGNTAQSIAMVPPKLTIRSIGFALMGAGIVLIILGYRREAGLALDPAMMHFGRSFSWLQVLSNLNVLMGGLIAAIGFWLSSARSTSKRAEEPK